METDDTTNSGKLGAAASNPKDEPGLSCVIPLLFLSEILCYDLGSICCQVQNTEKGRGVGNGGGDTFLLDLAAGGHPFLRGQCGLACGTEECVVWSLLLADWRIRSGKNFMLTYLIYHCIEINC